MTPLQPKSRRYAGALRITSRFVTHKIQITRIRGETVTLTRRKLMMLAAAVTAITLALAMLASGQSRAAAAASPQTVTLKAGAGTRASVTRIGKVNPANLAIAKPGEVQKLTAQQMAAVNRPLKSAAARATYRKDVLSSPGSLPTATGVRAPGKTPNSTITPSFIASSQQIPQLAKNGDGTTYSQSGAGTPPDQAVGTANPNTVFEGVNSLLQAYNSSFGTVFGPFTAQAFFAPLYHTGDFFSDPQITYNSTRQRWLVTWLEINSAATADYLDIAVSSTSSVSSPYYEYQIAADVTGSNEFCDYDTLGYEWNAAWVSCTTFDGTTGAFLGNRVFGFPLVQIDSGSLNNYVWYYNIPTDQNSGAYRLSPLVEDGTPQGEFIAATDAGFGVNSQNLTVCAVTRTYAIQQGGTPPATCAFTSTPLTYDDPIDAPQPGTSSTVYSGIGTKQLAYRAGRIWFAMPMALNCSGTAEDGIWWGDVVPQLTPISSSYPQSIAGIVSSYSENAYWCYSGGVYSYMPTIAPSAEGDATMMFNLSAASTYYPGIAYTGRMAVDAPGTMGSNGASAIVVAGSTDNTTGRYGDYSACALGNGNNTRSTLWCGGEYGGSDVWNTRLFQLRMQQQV
jgi:hypothetical protein